VKEAARRAIEADINQYAITWGARSLRQAIARKFERLYGVPVDPGAGGDGHLRLDGSDDGHPARHPEPGRRSDHLRALLRELRAGCRSSPEPSRGSSGCGRRIGPSIPDELARAFSAKTRAVIVNTPNNPTGKVFTRAELETIADLCRRHDALAVTDEIYEHILYDGAVHVPWPRCRAWPSARHHQRHEQDLQRDRLARGVDDRPRRCSPTPYARCMTS
jgi:aminotransferase